jgi:NTP pyrophosphatase (non-canonical NTP hydrolase)
MDKEQEAEVFRDAMNMWGTHAQMHMVVEEAAELIKAVCKMERASSDRAEALHAFIDELADVSIMVSQWIPEVGEDAFDRARDLKMRRLAGKLEKYREAHRTNTAMPWPTHFNLKEFM